MCMSENSKINKVGLVRLVAFLHTCDSAICYSRSQVRFLAKPIKLVRWRFLRDVHTTPNVLHAWVMTLPSSSGALPEWASGLKTLHRLAHSSHTRAL